MLLISVKVLPAGLHNVFIIVFIWLRIFPFPLSWLELIFDLIEFRDWVIVFVLVITRSFQAFDITLIVRLLIPCIILIQTDSWTNQTAIH